MNQNQEVEEGKKLQSLHSNPTEPEAIREVHEEPKEEEKKMLSRAIEVTMKKDCVFSSSGRKVKFYLKESRQFNWVHPLMYEIADHTTDQALEHYFHTNT